MKINQPTAPKQFEISTPKKIINFILNSKFHQILTTKNRQTNSKPKPTIFSSFKKSKKKKKISTSKRTIQKHPFIIKKK